MVDEHLKSYNSPFKYNGKEFDAETGNYYYGARYYDPKWSIFISVDKLAEQAPDWSPYRYGFNNPVRYTDPTGMFEVDDPPVGFPQADGATHSDDKGNWTYNKASDTWQGQGGTENLSNSIQLDEVVIGRSNAQSGGNGESADYLLAKLSWHNQFGGGADYNINASTLDFSGTSQRKLKLTGMKPGDSRYANLFNSGINPNSLAFGNLQMWWNRMDTV